MWPWLTTWRAEKTVGANLAIDHHVEAAFEKADQILAGIALHLASFLISALELLFGHVAVIALELLLGAQLNAEIADLALAALAVLAGAIRTLVDRGIGPTPDVFAHQIGRAHV